jgi:hypothetical protein
MPYLILIAAFFIVLSNQPVLMACAILSYIVVGRNFWKPGEPKTIFFGLTFFWLSISIKLFYAIYAGVTYESLSRSSNIIYTTYISLIGFFAFSYGIHVTTKKVREKNVIDFNRDFGYSPRRVVWVFIGSSVAIFLLKGAVFFIKGLDQLVFAIIDMKIGFIFLLLYFTFTRRMSLLVVVALLTLEIILSFFSFFASFKDILFTVLIILAIPRIQVTVKNIVLFPTLIFFTSFLLLKWQAIKGDYRAFLNKGTTSQKVEVSQSEALDKLQELAEKKQDITEDKNLIYESVDRISYIQFFSESMLKVPLFIPYENGKIWAGNISHVLLPRFFFPDKATIDDSQMVNKYCIRKVATAKQGVSFSLGFMAESYIDFGPVLMYLMVFLVGCLLGGIYALILKQSINYFWGYTMVVGLYTKIFCNGTAGSKILGWIITYYIAFLIFRRFLMKPLDKYLRTGSFV